MTESRQGRALILRLQGRLDARSAGTLASRLAAAIDAADCRIIVEGERLMYVDSAGLQALLVAAKRVRALGGMFGLVGLQEQVQRVVDLAGLGAILRVYATETDAVAAIA